jgi:hypothetical protein
MGWTIVFVSCHICLSGETQFAVITLCTSTFGVFDASFVEAIFLALGRFVATVRGTLGVTLGTLGGAGLPFASPLLSPLVLYVNPH